MLKPALASLLLATTLALPVHAQLLAGPGSSGPIDGIAAVVDEDVILLSELDRAVANLREQFRGRETQLPPENVLRRQVLERLVLTRLQVARAESTGIRIGDTELNQTLQGIAARSGIGIEQMRAQIEAQGLSFEDYRRSVREEMQMRRLQQRVIQGRVVVSESEVDQELARGAGADETEYRLANILVALPDGATPEQVAIAREKIDGVRGLIVRGEMDFRAAAIRYSDDRNALEGGDLGWRPGSAIPPRFAELVRGLQPGQFSEPLRGPSGYQLIQLVETRRPGPQTIVEYQADHLLVAVNEIVGEEAARRRIDELRTRIEAGEDFAALARQYSNDTMTRNRGGRLDWFSAEALGPEIAGQITPLADGQLSAVFRTAAGWHLLRRVGTREQDVTEENRRNRARQAIGERRAQEELERFLRQLRTDAFVESRLGAV
ncbi:peptidylprolyl isomerase [Silanimonas sp.]|uniref:peptidylprolyl isomerase n=1 Tax=Silanimonas sp. TaxID=1929290 RepID=UPI001BB93EBF|nr:peptidylprolyl isomerase [Silanimonas sp.]MBS3897094.1 peptidylprolyl isomerase [Silanimonas sp.]MBS3923956.1 peptidylprolyl isomerase [Xanthomonadaceae bacterium]